MKPASLRNLIAPVLVCSAVAIAAAPVAASPPDRAGRTPVANSAAARAQSSISQAVLARRLRRAAKSAGGRVGAVVLDGETGRVLFAKRPAKRRPLASNMKLFTTATALDMFGVDERLRTTAVRVGTIQGTLLNGNLFLRGGGDPTLGRRDVGQLAAEVKQAGITRITGRVYYDDSAFDRRPGVPYSHYRFTSELGRPLSAFSFSGRGGRKKKRRSPGRRAGLSFARSLRSHGVSVPLKVKRRRAGPGGEEVASVGSPTIASLSKATNVPSNNFLAEMLIKAIGANFGGRGSTRAGGRVVADFARQHGAGLRARDGSGLTRGNRASPASVARFLDEINDDEEIGKAFLGSLAVAGRSGTLARRMRGTAAQGRCRGKTGTINGVSNVSGYCLQGGRVVVFSFLMTGVELGRAHRVQDRMTALVARYGG